MVRQKKKVIICPTYFVPLMHLAHLAEELESVGYEVLFMIFFDENNLYYNDNGKWKEYLVAKNLKYIKVNQYNTSCGVIGVLKNMYRQLMYIIKNKNRILNKETFILHTFSRTPFGLKWLIKCNKKKGGYSAFISWAILSNPLQKIEKRKKKICKKTGTMFSDVAYLIYKGLILIDNLIFRGVCTSKENIYGGVQDDYVLVRSEQEKDKLKSYVFEEKIIALGYIYQDVLRDKKCRNSDKKLALVLSNYFVGEKNYMDIMDKYIDMLLHHGYDEVIIKIHPRNKLKPYERYFDKHNVKIDQNASIDHTINLICSAEIILGNYSTLMVDAVIARKIVFGWHGFDSIHYDLWKDLLGEWHCEEPDDFPRLMNLAVDGKYNVDFKKIENKFTTNNRYFEKLCFIIEGNKIV